MDAFVKLDRRTKELQCELEILQANERKKLRKHKKQQERKYKVLRHKLLVSLFSIILALIMIRQMHIVFTSTYQFVFGNH
jgi:hypothetical protein